jgi:hypothetical protein
MRWLDWLVNWDAPEAAWLFPRRYRVRLQLRRIGAYRMGGM